MDTRRRGLLPSPKQLKRERRKKNFRSCIAVLLQFYLGVTNNHRIQADQDQLYIIVYQCFYLVRRIGLSYERLALGHQHAQSIRHYSEGTSETAMVLKSATRAVHHAESAATVIGRIGLVIAAIGYSCGACGSIACDYVTFSVEIEGRKTRYRRIEASCTAAIGIVYIKRLVSGKSEIK
ncbi:hypothetical protein F4808DRAFT_281652 [Astrocystis sublimbata]|nr:hypothetical protein F4808DRAFT_281652 [Astrocystis sublimbata]